MRLREKVSWLIGRMQRQLFLFIEECRISPLTKQGKWLVKILELAKVKAHAHAYRNEKD